MDAFLLSDQTIEQTIAINKYSYHRLLSHSTALIRSSGKDEGWCYSSQLKTAI